VAMMVVVVFAREMVKDATGIKGDVMAGYPTVPATVGLRRTGQIVAFSLTGIPLLSVVMLPGLNEPVQMLLIVANVMVFITLVGALLARSPKGFGRINLLLKVIIIGGVVSLLFFRL
jgi:4-hydroxybenzoate polyprenyltransferase